MIPTAPYLRLLFRADGRERPHVDCWGLYRLVLGEQLGVWLPELSGNVRPLEIARNLKGMVAGADWLPVESGEEKAGDLVLMTAVAGRGRGAVVAPLHVGCVTEPGVLIDIEDGEGVRVRAFRNTERFSADAAVARRVRGLFRPAELAHG